MKCIYNYARIPQCATSAGSAAIPATYLARARPPPINAVRITAFAAYYLFSGPFPGSNFLSHYDDAYFSVLSKVLPFVRSSLVKPNDLNASAYLNERRGAGCCLITAEAGKDATKRLATIMLANIMSSSISECAIGASSGSRIYTCKSAPTLQRSSSEPN